jgi:PST family polysaccharide transporter
VKAALKATAVLGSVSVVNVLGGLISTKVAALLVGPGGVGYIGLLQSMVGLSALIASMGVGAGLVRDGARALAQDDPRRFAALRRAAWLLCLGIGGVAALLLVLFRVPISALMLGTAERQDAVIVMALALFISLAGGLQTSILNAHRRVADLARSGIIAVLLNVTVTVTVLAFWREGGIVPAVLGGFSAGWLVSFYFMRTKVPAGSHELQKGEVREAAGALLRFGLPYTASALVGAGVLLVVPVLVLHALGPADVGYYRAAATISINYLGFLVVAMAQDYYPRVSAAEGAPALVALVNEQLRLVLLLAGPLILLMLALVPWLVPLIYTSQFAAAGELLEWQLIGDLFKFSCWTMTFVILASLGSRVYFWTECFGGAVLLFGSWLGMHLLGLAGLGIAFLAAGGSACLLCSIVLRRAIGLRWSAGNKLLFLAFAAAMALIRALPHLGLLAWRTPVALLLAAIMGSVSLYLIWSVFGGWQALTAWRKRSPAPAQEESI